MNFIKFPLSADFAVSAPPLVTSPPVDRPTLPPPKRSISVLLKLMAVQPLKTGRIRSHMVIFMTKTTTFPPHFVHFLIKKFQRAEASFWGGLKRHFLLTILNEDYDVITKVIGHNGGYC